MAAYKSCIVGALCRRHRLEEAAHSFARGGRHLRTFADRGNKRSMESPFSFVGEEPLCPLALPRPYGVASPDTSVGSTVEPFNLFAHGVENPPLPNAFVPMAADVSALEREMAG